MRIVHGKGFGSRSGVPIMKAHVDRWLRDRSEVLAFCSALPPDGGTGRALRAAQTLRELPGAWPRSSGTPSGSYRSIMVSGSHVASSGYMMRSTSTSRSRTMKGMTPL